MKLGEAYVEIRGPTAKLKEDMGRAQRLFRSTVHSLRRYKWHLTAAFGAVTAAAFTAVKAFAKQEQAERTLSASMRFLNVDVRAQTTELKKLATAIQEAAGIGDEEFLPVIASGAKLARVHGQELKTLSIAAVGFSKIIGVDVKTSMMLLSRAVQGQFQLFSRYGISLDETLTAQQKLDSVIRTGIGGFQIARDETDTLTGEMGKLRDALGDVTEGFGEMIVGANKGKQKLSEMTDFAVGLSEALKQPGSRGALAGIGGGLGLAGTIALFGGVHGKAAAAGGVLGAEAIDELLHWGEASPKEMMERVGRQEREWRQRQADLDASRAAKEGIKVRGVDLLADLRKKEEAERKKRLEEAEKARKLQQRARVQLESSFAQGTLSLMGLQAETLAAKGKPFEAERSRAWLRNEQQSAGLVQEWSGLPAEAQTPELFAQFQERQRALNKLFDAEMASIEKRRKDATISAATMGLSAFGGLGISMGGPRTAIGYGERATSGANATNQILRDSLNIQRQIARNTSGGMGAATP